MTDSTSDPKHIFISYARADGSDHAQALQTRLEGRGYTCWRDTRDLDRNQDFTAEIEMAIRRRSWRHGNGSMALLTNHSRTITSTGVTSWRLKTSAAISFQWSCPPM